MGKAELRKIRKALGRGVPYCTTPCTKEDLKKKLQKPNPKQWKRIWRKFLKTNPLGDVLRIFKEVNSPNVRNQYGSRKIMRATEEYENGIAKLLGILEGVFSK